MSEQLSIKVPMEILSFKRKIRTEWSGNIKSDNWQKGYKGIS